MNALTSQEIKQRLRAAGLGSACSWDGEGVVLPRESGVAESDYDAAKAIVEACVAEGDRRFKTPGEFWASLIAYPEIAQAAAFKWAAVVSLRQIAIGDPAAMDEIIYQAGLEVQQADPTAYAAMEAAGLLTFDATTTEPLPNA